MMVWLTILIIYYTVWLIIMSIVAGRMMERDNKKSPLFILFSLWIFCLLLPFIVLGMNLHQYYKKKEELHES